jgi:S-methylmethionine-dependent homocysteine/selenocysteine methylase
MLWLEMMKDEEHAPRAVRAAAASGLPIFLGFSARTDRETGKPVLWGNGVNAIPLQPEWFHSLKSVLGDNLVGVNVMHTNFSTMEATLKFVREDCGWQGPLGAYPDHGRFEAPDWVFEELDNAEAMQHVEKWIAQYGVQLVGGCCGLGPEYITALSAFARRHNAIVRSK